MIGHWCARCGVEIPEDAEGGVEWFYIPEAGIPEDDPAPEDPMKPRGQLICAACNS
jgi:hypothetical protein